MLHFQVAMHQTRLYKPLVAPLSCSYRLFWGVKESKTNHWQSKSHASFPVCFFFSFSQNISNQRHLFRIGLYPAHITLPIITFPTCRHWNAKAGVKCTAQGKADWSVYLEISILVKRRQVNILPGALAQYTHLPWANQGLRALQGKVLHFHCASFSFLLPSQPPGGCCKGVRSRLSAHPNRPCQEG